ncbi:hypothetical protein HDU96_010141 [Phlyctochytrium bullatum]|nr:hypothetical protein HDU96_010141 [Phlyctochytrium bullatum]
MDSTATLLGLPVELLRAIALLLHPHDAVITLRSLCRSARALLVFNSDFAFALENLRGFLPDRCLDADLHAVLHSHSHNQQPNNHWHDDDSSDASSRSPSPTGGPSTPVLMPPHLSLDFRRLGVSYISAFITLKNLTATTFAALTSLPVPNCPQTTRYLPPVLIPAVAHTRRATLTATMVAHFPISTHLLLTALHSLLDTLHHRPLDLTADDFFALRWAVALDNPVLLTRLLSLLPTPLPHQHLFRHAVRADAPRVATLLLPHADPAADDAASLRDAAALGHRALVSLLLRVKPPLDPAARANAALRAAAANGHTHVVADLIATGRCPPCKLVGPASRGHADVVRLLVDCGRHPDPEDGAAVVEAAAAGHEETLDVLIGAGVGDGAAVNRALVAAARNGRWECCRLLVATRKVTSAVMPELAEWMARDGEGAGRLRRILLEA